MDEALEQDVDRLVVDDVPGGIFKVHSRAYTDPKIFELEKQRIFNKSWIFVGHESEIRSPGSFQRRHVAGRDVLMTRGDDGSIRVLLNHCSHRGTLVCHERSGTVKFFRCPYHAWTYDTCGKLTAVPGVDAYGPGWKKSDYNLKSAAQVENHRGFIFACFDKDAEGLSSSLAGAEDYLDLVCDQSEVGLEVLPGTHKYAIKANWKLLIENFVDNYHFALLHTRQLQHMRELGAHIGPHGGQSVGSNGRSLGKGHGVAEHQQFATFGRLAGHWGGLLPEWTKQPLEEIRTKLEARVGAERAHRITRTNRNVRFFPTMVVLDHVLPLIRVMTPRAVDYTEIQEFLLAPIDERPDMRELRIANSLPWVGPGGFVSGDDVEVLELTQMGLNNPEMEWVDNSRGMAIRRYVSSDEHQMRGMQRHWHELMTMKRVLHPDDV